MAVDLELEPMTKRPPGEPCCEPVVYPDVEREQAQRMAKIAKALATGCGCGSSTSCASTPARPASASWLGSSTSPSLR
jgi:hypothetical protein